MKYIILLLKNISLFLGKMTLTKKVQNLQNQIKLKESIISEHRTQIQELETQLDQVSEDCSNMVIALAVSNKRQNRMDMEAEKSKKLVDSLKTDLEKYKICLDTLKIVSSFYLFYYIYLKLSIV